MRWVSVGFIGHFALILLIILWLPAVYMTFRLFFWPRFPLCFIMLVVVSGLHLFLYGKLGAGGGGVMLPWRWWPQVLTTSVNYSASWRRAVRVKRLVRAAYELATHRLGVDCVLFYPGALLGAFTGKLCISGFASGDYVLKRLPLFILYLMLGDL